MLFVFLNAQSARACFTLLKLEILHLHSPVMLANQLDGYLHPLTIKFSFQAIQEWWEHEVDFRRVSAKGLTCSNLRI